MALKTTLGMTFAGVLFAATLAGCGGSDQLPTVKAAGTVTLDGKPYGPASVTLTPAGGNPDDKRRPAVGPVAKDGSFTLRTYEEGDGAPPGEYTATLGPDTSEAASTDPNKMMGAMTGPPAETLKVTIPEGGSDSLKLEFKSTKQKKGPADKLLGT